ncbi:TIGR00299 family protein, partial [Paenibacillus macerans]
MTKALYLDCHAGIAGDMLLSALVDLGANPEDIESELKKLPLDRHVNDIFKMIDDSTLPERVKYRSKKIFEIIGQAEAKIHGMSFEEVHFHEVGAMDSIIDIIGGCIALEQLGINTLYCSAIPTGHGKINIAHGIYPIPAPATAEILKGIPIAH